MTTSTPSPAPKELTAEQLAGVIRGLDNAYEYCGRTQAYDSQRAIREAAAAISLLTARLAAAERDAGRYRWLRDGDIQARNGLYVADAGNEWASVEGEQLDEALDAARANANEGDGT